VPTSLTDFGGWEVGAEDFLGAVLQTVAQPIWVVDPDGLIRYANPAAVAVLGYDAADELLGRPSHDTIHHHRPDGSPYPTAECPMLLPRTTGERVSSELDWFFRRDGSMFPVSYVSLPIEMPAGRGAVVAFEDIEDRLRAEEVLRDHDEMLAAEQAALRRVATLVARRAGTSEVFAAVAAEVSDLLHLPLVEMCRYESDGTATVLAATGEHAFQPGTRWTLDGPSLTAQVHRTGRPARVDDYAVVDGAIGEAARGSGVHAGVGAPIMVDGRLWGVVSAGGGAQVPLARGAETRLGEFTDLVATAIANAEAREGLHRLAGEQAALRRVAVLVAQGAPAETIFDAVCEETGRLFGATSVNLAHFTPDGVNVTMAGWSLRGVHVSTGTRIALEGDTINALVRHTAAPGRFDSYEGASGELAALLRRQGVRSEVGAPVLVDGAVWGALIAGTDEPQPLPAGTEDRLAEFAELIATAVSNASARSELIASRARLVTETDAARQRLARDLHDGAQQRLVTALMSLQLADQRIDTDVDAGARLLREALVHTREGLAELRELAAGVHPSLLTNRGLRAAVEALADRSPVPVDVELPAARFPAPAEAGAYFLIAEALTNVAKHACASRASVRVAEGDGRLQIVVEDDGDGGARLDGHGMRGMADRAEALGGSLRLESPPGRGTRIEATLPVITPA
jgi:PAS domain S-box-containing protein